MKDLPGAPAPGTGAASPAAAPGPSKTPGLISPPGYDPGQDCLTWMWRGDVDAYEDRITVNEETVGYVLRSRGNGAAVGVRVLGAKGLVCQVIAAELLEALKLNQELLAEEGDPYA